MANKKCPKCGEDNPAEAVMCWACYTPLSGAAPLTASAAALPATAGAGARPAVPGLDAGDTQKKDLDPKIIGVVVLFVIAAIIGGVVMFGNKGESPSDVVPGVAPEPPPMVGSGGGAPTGPSAPAFIPPVPQPGVPAVPATPLPYQTVAQPNPAYPTGTIGVLATQPNIAPTEALKLAKFVRNQFQASGKWKNMQVAVFSDSQSAKGFQTYQAARKNMKLEAADYQALASQGVWTGTAAFYETAGSRETPYYPSRNPNGWWGTRR